MSLGCSVSALVPIVAGCLPGHPGLGGPDLRGIVKPQLLGDRAQNARSPGSTKDSHSHDQRNCPVRLDRLGR